MMPFKNTDYIEWRLKADIIISEKKGNLHGALGRDYKVEF
jgi:hypothetical protein